jgi:homoserine dehydrogenase
MDAFHKAVLLASLGFGAVPNLSAADVTGIDRLDAADIRLAGKLGYRVKLVARARETEAGIHCQVGPVLLPPAHPLAAVDGALNAVLIDAEPVGRITLSGPGAGEGATASAVVGDLGRLFESRPAPVFGAPVGSLGQQFIAGPRATDADAFFLSLRLADRPGSLAALTQALAKAELSVAALIQEAVEGGEAAPVGIITHRTPHSHVARAMETVQTLEVVVDAPVLIRIEAARS